jgi:hypothetical protein
MPGANAPYTEVPRAGCGVIEPGASSTLVPVMSGKMVTHSSGCSHWISRTHEHRIVPRVRTFCLHVTWSVSLRRPMQVKRAASSGVQWYQSPLGVVPRKSTLETIWLIYADSGERTSGLEPLTCSLRVRNRRLPGIAAACYERRESQTMLCSKAKRVAAVREPTPSLW